jgi:ribose transport system permease protein
MSGNPWVDLPSTFKERLLNWRWRQFIVAPILMLIALFVTVIMDRDNLGLAFVGIFPLSIIYGLLALGAGVVIASSLIDLSAAGVATLSAVLFALVLSMLSSIRNEFAIAIAAIAAVGFSTLSGWLVAHCVVNLRAPPLIFTWAIGSIYVIVAILFSDAAIVPVQHGVEGIYIAQADSYNFYEFGAVGFWLGLIAISVLMVAINAINLPQRAAAIGAGEKSARYAGVSKRLTLYQCFIVNAIAASLAGMFLAAEIGRAATRDLVGKELIPIAIAVLGGTVLSGGFIKMWPILASAVFWSAIQQLGPNFPRFLPGLKWLHAVESEVGQILYFVVFAVIVVVLGRYLTPTVPKVYARKE